jgi:Winged helix DNA-binding domain
VEELRPALVTFTDVQGTELFDLPGAPRPGASVPAPARLVAEFDNLVLSHADRSRILSAENAKRLYTVNGVIPGAVLIDGFVAGMWRLAAGRALTTLGIELFGPAGGQPAGEWPPAGEREGLIGEAERVLEFCAPGTAHHIRFGPLAELAVRRP